MGRATVSYLSQLALPCTFFMLESPKDSCQVRANLLRRALAAGRCPSQWSSKMGKEREAWVAVDTGSRSEHLPSPWRNEEQ